MKCPRCRENECLCDEPMVKAVAKPTRAYDDFDLAYAQKVATNAERLRIRRAQRDALRELMSAWLPSVEPKGRIAELLDEIDVSTRAPRKERKR